MFIISYGIILDNIYKINHHITYLCIYRCKFTRISFDSWAKIKTTSSEEELKSYLFSILRSLNLPADQNNFRLITKQIQLFLSMSQI